MWRWLASARAVAALFLARIGRQPVLDADDTPLRPYSPEGTLTKDNARCPAFVDEVRAGADALERGQPLLAPPAESATGPPADSAARVHSCGGLQQNCPCSGQPSAGRQPEMTSSSQAGGWPEYLEAATAEDYAPPPDHTTKYSPEVRRSATYRDLYQPD